MATLKTALMGASAGLGVGCFLNARASADMQLEWGYVCGNGFSEWLVLCTLAGLLAGAGTGFAVARTPFAPSASSN